jgi:hypothetical protein
MALLRHACERRVYRLALLLTGSPSAACTVTERVVAARPDLRVLDSAHMDRLTILRCRETPPAAIVDPDVPPRLAEAISSLRSQPREAWVLREVYALPLREISRAMDCSTTALRRHLEEAQAHVREALGAGAVEAPAALARFSGRLELPRLLRRRLRRRRQRRLLLLVIAVATAALAVLGLLPRLIELIS